MNHDHDGHDHDRGDCHDDDGHHGRREGGGHERGGGGGGGGPNGTDFLDLEISQVLYSEAEKLTRDVVGDILRDAIELRLRERLGDKLGAIGRLAADALADDVEANLAIEQRIQQHRDHRRSAEGQLREILFGKGGGARGEGSGEGSGGGQQGG
jgi:hypothetical protein